MTAHSLGCVLLPGSVVHSPLMVVDESASSFRVVQYAVRGGRAQDGWFVNWSVLASRSLRGELAARGASSATGRRKAMSSGFRLLGRRLRTLAYGTKDRIHALRNAGYTVDFDAIPPGGGGEIVLAMGRSSGWCRSRLRRPSLSIRSLKTVD